MLVYNNIKYICMSCFCISSFWLVFFFFRKPHKMECGAFLFQLMHLLYQLIKRLDLIISSLVANLGMSFHFKLSLISNWKNFVFSRWFLCVCSWTRLGEKKESKRDKTKTSPNHWGANKMRVQEPMGITKNSYIHLLILRNKWKKNSWNGCIVNSGMTQWKNVNFISGFPFRTL